MKQQGRDFPNLQDYAVHLMKQLDQNNDGFVDLSEFSNGLK
tara:strand:+ start:404 stop:526 length:123 start_codon:yes stop_codon:yes gene_type:complete